MYCYRQMSMLITAKQNYDKYPFVGYYNCTRDVQKVFVTVIFKNIYFMQNYNLIFFLFQS